MAEAVEEREYNRARTPFLLRLAPLAALLGRIMRTAQYSPSRSPSPQGPDLSTTPNDRTLGRPHCRDDSARLRLLSTLYARYSTPQFLHRDAWCDR